MIYDLTEEQKEEILKLFKKNPDLMFITRKVFNDDDIDGRSKQGRAVRKFLAGQDKKANTSSMLGYYASVNFVNNSTEKAELFSVGSEITESSK